VAAAVGVSFARGRSGFGSNYEDLLAKDFRRS
jgi:hypothetical protein